MDSRLKSSCYCIDPQGDYSIGLLISREQKCTRGIDSEIPRSFSLSRCVLQVRKLAATLIDYENYDAIVAAVRAIKKLSRWRYMQVCAIVVA